MEEIINKMFKEKYPKGLSAEYTKEEMVGYMMAINDIKEQLSIHVVSNRFSEQDMENAYDKGFKDGGTNDLRGSLIEFL